MDDGAVHLLVEIEIEGIERAIRIAETRLLVPALEEPVLPTEQLVGHEHRHEIDRCKLFRLGVT